MPDRSEQYRFKSGTPLNDQELNNRFLDLNSRVLGLEIDRLTEEDAFSIVLDRVLSRSEGVIASLRDRLLQITELQWLTAHSSTPRTLAEDAEFFLMIEEDDRALFAPGPFAVLTRTTTPDDYAVVETLAYDRANGRWDVKVRSFAGAPGPHADWQATGLAGSTLAQMQLLQQGRQARDVAEGVAGDLAGVLADAQAVAEAGAPLIAAKDLAVAAAGTATAKRDEALALRNEAATFRDQAEGHKTTAGISAATATAKAADATAKAATATTKRDEALAFRDAAEGFRNTAVAAADTATAKATETSDATDVALAAAADAVAARDQIQAERIDRNTVMAETAIRAMIAIDVANVPVPQRPARRGVAWSVDFAGPFYTLGLARIPESFLEFTRAGAGGAIGGGASANFATNEPRIHGGALQLDAGGENLFLSSSNFGHANWAKANVAPAVAADGPAGLGTASFFAEAAAAGNHSVSQDRQPFAATDTLIFMATLKLVGRDYLQMDLFNGATTSGVRARFQLTGNGAVVSPYPAGLGAGATQLKAGIFHEGDGFYTVWATCKLPATTTRARCHLYAMSDAATTNYAGDPTKGVTLAAAWLVPTNKPVNYIHSTDAATGVRAPETFSVPLATGFYMARVVDEVSETIEPFAVDFLGDRYALSPSTDRLRIKQAEFYVAEAYDDTLDRGVTTAQGTLGIASDGGTYTLLEWAGAYPMAVATRGRLVNGWFTVTPAAGQAGTVYAVRDLGAGKAAKFARAMLRFGGPVAGAGALSNTSACILFSNDLPNLISRMPVHVVITRSGVSVQKRGDGGAFTTLGEIRYGQTMPPDGITEHEIRVALHDDKLTVTFDGKSVTVQDPIFREACRYVCWEIQTTSDHTTDLAQLSGFYASTAEVGPAPAYVAAAPVNDVPPVPLGIPTAGTVFSVDQTRGRWRSNAGPIAFSQQWQLNGVDVGGATATAFPTTDGVDEGKKVSVRETATNTAGSSSATSAQSAALA